MREALFSLVGQDCTGRRVLDAFGGTGLLALEAWSRGATGLIVERDPSVAAAIRASLLALDAPLEVRVGDVLALARRDTLGRFDLVLADPPYAHPPAAVVDALAGLTTGTLVLETAEATPPPPAPRGLVLDRRRTYGASALVLYRAAPSGPAGAGDPTAVRVVG